MRDGLISSKAMSLAIAAAVALGGWLIPSAAQAAEVESEAASMPFDQCLEVIRRAAVELGVAPINIVETNVLRMVRFCAADASVLVSCSQPDQKMVVTRSQHRPGCD